MQTRRNKWGNKPYDSPILNRRFHSTGEGHYGEHLFARQQNGEISDLEFQVRWDCMVGGKRIGKRRMVIDFRYYEKSRGEIVWDDFKGEPTTEWLIKADIWRAGGPGLLVITQKPKGKLGGYTQREIRPND